MNARDATQPHALVNQLYAQMTLPVICSPMFIVSNPKLVVAQCANGVMGSFPALNPRPPTLLDALLSEVQEGLAAPRPANLSAVGAPFTATPSPAKQRAGKRAW